MFRLFFIIVCILFSTSAFSQSYGIDPVTYTPLPRTLAVPTSNYETFTPDFNFSSYSHRNPVTINSKETISVSAFELESCNTYDVQVTITEYSNGNVKLTCCGIKQNGKWNPVTANVLSLQELYENCNKNDTETKSAILTLMEYANFIMQYKGRTFVL